MKYFVSILCLLNATTALVGQTGTAQVGARGAGMAYTTSTLSDSWALFNNPGGLGDLHETTALFAFENRYSIEGLNIAAAGALTTLPLGSIGFSLLRFGDELYSEQTASVSYGNKFGIASLGISVNYLQYHIEGFGDHGTITLDFGGIAQVTEFLYFGAYIRNINQAKVAVLHDERAPTILNAGLSYRPGKKIMLNIEAEKDIDYEASFRSGLEYKFYKKFSARTGIRTNPFTNYFGLGFSTLRLHIAYALTHDALLGNCHQAAISYKIDKR